MSPSYRKRPEPFKWSTHFSTSPLTEADLENLERSGISREIASAALRRVDSLTGAQIVGRSNSADYAGILIPNLWPGTDYVRENRLRRDHPEIENGKPKNKYLSPPGRGNMLYFVPWTAVEWLSDKTIPIILTEGEKKCLALWELAWARCWRRRGSAALAPNSNQRRVELARENR